MRKETYTADLPQPDPTQVFWSDTLPKARIKGVTAKTSRVKPRFSVVKYYEAWRKFDAPMWEKPLFPKELSDKELKVAQKEYLSLPESFYSDKRLPVITPLNYDAWLEHMVWSLTPEEFEDLKIELWSWFSGTGRMAKTMMTKTKAWAVLFPVDLRYGWNLMNVKHRKLLREIDDFFQPNVTTMEPRCKY